MAHRRVDVAPGKGIHPLSGEHAFEIEVEDARVGMGRVAGLTRSVVRLFAEHDAPRPDGLHEVAHRGRQILHVRQQGTTMREIEIRRRHGPRRQVVRHDTPSGPFEIAKEAWVPIRGHDLSLLSHALGERPGDRARSGPDLEAALAPTDPDLVQASVGRWILDRLQLFQAGALQASAHPGQRVTDLITHRILLDGRIHPAVDRKRHPQSPPRPLHVACSRRADYAAVPHGPPHRGFPLSSPRRLFLSILLVSLLSISTAANPAAAPADSQADTGTSPPADSQADTGASPPADSQADTGASPPADAHTAAGTSPDWPQHGRTASEERFSPLDQIDRNNVARLGPAWSFPTGSKRGLEATPLVVEGVLYATASWSVVFAVDAKSGRLLWRHDPQVPRWKARHACCGVVNRGVAYAQHEGQPRIYAATLDGRLQALDARTGELVWSVRTTEISQPYTITGAPRIVKDLVVIGNGGAEYGVRGYFSAYHVKDGSEAWRFYTVPGSKDGPHEHPELDGAAETWPADALWESGLGGTAWDAMAYDPELDLLYVGTGNASVYDRAKRSPGGGDNLYLASILALRPDTGRLVWHYQTTPGEHWDYTATQHMILTDLNWRGVTRKVLMQAPKNGFFYVLDRTDGELLSAEKFAHASWASHVDLQTGRPVERPEATWSETPRFVSPPPPGAHNWHPMSFHPQTGLVYIPVSESIYAFYPDADFRFQPGRWNTGEDFHALHAAMEDRAATRFLPCGLTRLVAWDPLKGKKAWEVLHDAGVPGGTLATAGGLVFQGSGKGRFSAYDALNGQIRWSVELGIDVMAPPISYAVDGEQYIAVLAGVGGVHGNHASQFDHDNAGRLLAFKLDGQAPLPAVQKRPERERRVPELAVSEEIVDQGRRVYAEHCFTCHGMGAHASGLYPDLRTASPETHTRWDEIVRGGTRTANGMPSFADVVSAAEAEAVRAYILERAWHAPNLTERLLEFVAEHACLPVSWATD